MENTLRRTKPAALNHALIARTAVESSALVVRGTIIHRLTTPGVFRVEAFQGERHVHRERIVVTKESAKQAVTIALNQDATGGSCGCAEKQVEERQPVGIDSALSVYVARGAGRYSVRVTQLTEKKSFVVFDSAKALDKDDLFAATLVAPGEYALEINKSKVADIVVDWPNLEKKSPRSPPIMFSSSKKAEKPLALQSGGTIAVYMDAPGSVTFKPIDVAPAFAYREHAKS